MENVDNETGRRDSVEKKEDRRVTLTKRMLKDALIDLLREVDIYHVSIRELCQRADVNRTTFYKYYGSQFDLLADMENDLLAFLSKIVTENASDPEKIIEAACGYMENHLEFGRMIINNNVDPLFPQKLFSLAAIREAALQKHTDLQDEAMQDYLYNYMTYGAYQVIYLWMNKEKREPPEELAHMLMHFLQPG